MAQRRFEGRVVLVTGAGSGLGRATALRLAAEGAAVAALDVAGDAADETAGQVRRRGGRATAEAVDVTDLAALESAVARVAAVLGRPQVVVTSAGTGGFVRSEDETAEHWERIVAVNLTGTFFTCRAALPHLLDGGGVIVTVASNAGLMGQPWSAAYCASKGGVVNLTRALAVEYVGRGVRVNCVAPGGMRTPLTKGFRPPEGADLDDLRPLMSRIGVAEPDEVAACIAYVASDDARYMVGSVVSIDGGLVAYGGGFPA